MTFPNATNGNEWDAVDCVNASVFEVLIDIFPPNVNILNMTNISNTIPLSWNIWTTSLVYGNGSFDDGVLLIQHGFCSFCPQPANGRWRKWTIQVISVCKTKCCPVLTERIWTDGQKSRTMQLRRVCGRREQIVWFDKETKQEAVFCPSQEIHSATNQPSAFGSSAQLRPLTPQWPRCPFDVWARLQVAASRCECATPAPEKKKGERMRKCADSGEKLLPVKEKRRGCYAWINTARTRVDGRALLILWKTWSDTSFWIKAADTWYLMAKFLCVCQYRNMSVEGLRSIWYRLKSMTLVYYRALLFWGERIWEYGCTDYTKRQCWLFPDTPDATYCISGGEQHRLAIVCFFLVFLWRVDMLVKKPVDSFPYWKNAFLCDAKKGATAVFFDTDNVSCGPDVEFDARRYARADYTWIRSETARNSLQLFVLCLQPISQQ